MQNKKTQTSTKRNPAPRWPDAARFQEMLWTVPATEIAKRLGVSYALVLKRARGLRLPPRGYWQKLINKTK